MLCIRKKWLNAQDCRTGWLESPLRIGPYLIAEPQQSSRAQLAHLKSGWNRPEYASKPRTLTSQCLYSLWCIYWNATSFFRKPRFFCPFKNFRLNRQNLYQAKRQKAPDAEKTFLVVEDPFPSSSLEKLFKYAWPKSVLKMRGEKSQNCNCEKMEQKSWWVDSSSFMTREQHFRLISFRTGGSKESFAFFFLQLENFCQKDSFFLFLKKKRMRITLKSKVDRFHCRKKVSLQLQVSFFC